MNLTRRTKTRTMFLGVSLALLMATMASTASASGAEVDRVDGPFETVVPVAFADNAAGVELMFAECAFVQRTQKPDGSASETQACHLTEPFFVFPGSPPESAFVIAGGACLWFSDYWTQTTGDDVVADSNRIVVTPSGQVHVTSTYPSVPIPPADC